MRHAERLLTQESAEKVASHLDSCRQCREKAHSIRAFGARLNTQWLSERLSTIIRSEGGCPSPDELAEYYLGEIAPFERERLRGHVEGCTACQAVLAEMEEGTATLARADPLGARETRPTEPWWSCLRGALDLWPGPAWAGATIAVGIAFVAGLLLRPMLIGSPLPVPGREIYRIAKPPFTPAAEVHAFGIAPAVRPEADRRFGEAMAFYAEPDFPDKALPKLKEAVALDPRHDRAQFWLGIAHLLKGEARLAIEALEAAAALAPANLEYKHYLVWAYLKAGQVEKALRLQTQVLERRQIQ